MVKKSDKINTISCHVLRNNELNSIKEKQLEMADSMSYADQQDDKSLSDDDNVVGTFGSDSECSHERLRVFSCSLFFHVLRCVKLV